MKSKKRNIQKLILGTIALFFLVSAGNAQVLLALLFGDKLASDTLQLGIVFDVSGSDMNGAAGTKMLPGIAFGMFIEQKLGEKWSLQPELILKSPAGAKKYAGGDPGNPCLDELFTGDGSVTRELAYFSLPIFIKYRIKSFGILAGPQISYLRNATDIYEGTTTGENEFTLKKDIKESLNRWDVGFSIGLEFSLQPTKKLRSMRIHVKYYQGLLDVVKDDSGGAVNNYAIMVGIGFPVGGGSKDEDKK